MTVKCLTSASKKNIAEAFLIERYSINELALHFNRSRRTIIRVLEEHEIDPGIKHRKPKTPKTPQYGYQVSSEDVGLGQTVISVEPPFLYPITYPQPKTNSWFRRIGAFFGSLRHQGVASQ